MVLQHFILPEMQFKANLFFSIMAPPNTPHHSASGPSGWGVQKGWMGFHKGEKKVDSKIHFRWFKAFLDHVFFPNKGGGWLGPDP